MNTPFSSMRLNPVVLKLFRILSLLNLGLCVFVNFFWEKDAVLVFSWLVTIPYETNHQTKWSLIWGDHLTSYSQLRRIKFLIVTIFNITTDNLDLLIFSRNLLSLNAFPRLLYWPLPWEGSWLKKIYSDGLD